MIAVLAFLLTLPTGQDAPIVGPGLLCMKYSSFELVEGERVLVAGLGIESMRLDISGPRGRYTIAESELMGGPEGTKHLIETRRDARIYSVGRDAYAFRGDVPFSLHGKALAGSMDRFFVSIRGSALNRDRNARAILPRLKLGIPTAEHCIMRYQYGWEYALPPETE